jgi:hypothetical protein
MHKAQEMLVYSYKIERAISKGVLDNMFTTIVAQRCSAPHVIYRSGAKTTHYMQGVTYYNWASARSSIQSYFIDWI